MWLFFFKKVKKGLFFYFFYIWASWRNGASGANFPPFCVDFPRHFRCDGGETLEFWVRFGVHFQIYTRLFSQR